MTARVGTASITETEPATGGGTQVIEQPVPSHEGDHDRFSHYAERDKITEAMVTGTPVVALCGKVWVPSRDPKNFPVCPECERLYEMGLDGRMNEWRDRSGGDR